jgi:hypothetical protein
MPESRGRKTSMARMAVVVFVGVAIGGCGQPTKKPAAQTDAATEGYSVTLNRDDNGAAAQAQNSKPADTLLVPRTLSFEMAGFAKAPPAGEPIEERSAAGQAAIIDAFAQALMEARRQRGQATTDFTAQLGPRLTVRHCRVNGANQIEVALITRGTETTFLVRDGILQHPPRDLKLVQRIFEETNGEFALLGTEWLPDRGQYVATVGCYLPAGINDALAGEADAEPAASPAAP